MDIKHQIAFTLATFWRIRATSTGSQSLSILWERWYGEKKGHQEVSSSGRELLAQEERNAEKKQCQSKVKLKVRPGRN